MLFALFPHYPESMLDKDETDLVLGACPQLTSVTFDIYVEYSTVTSLALDLPSSERLTLRGYFETSRLTCPNLKHVDITRCQGMLVPPTLMAQLTRFDGETNCDCETNSSQ